LIFKDILKPSVDANKVLIYIEISEFFIKGLNTVITAFLKVLKQLAYLCNYIVKSIRKVVALIAIVPTQ
jgi:hypothetical protein